MLTAKLESLGKQPKSFLLALECILVVGMGWVDYIVGTDIPCCFFT